MANQKQTKTQKQPHKRRNADPPARYAFRHPAEKQSKQQKGQGPTKTTTNKDLPWTQWYKATVSQLKIMHQTNWLLPSKVKHAFLIVAADRQQKNASAVHNCVLASQSPLTGSCSGVQCSVDVILNCFFTCKDRASERDRPYQRKKKHYWVHMFVTNSLYRQTTVGYWFCTFATNSFSASSAE